MTKRIKLLLIAAALTLPALVATTATAGPDCDNPKFTNNHPLCSDSPTTTTSTTEPAVDQACETITTLPAAGQSSFGCDWTPTDTGTSTGTIEVRTISGEVSRVAVFVRDSDPGDICLLEQWEKPTSDVVEASFPLIYDNGETYWTHGGTHWCAPFDDVIGERADLNGNPLHLEVSVRGKKNTIVEVTLTPGQTP